MPVTLGNKRSKKFLKLAVFGVQVGAFLIDFSNDSAASVNNSKQLLPP